MENLEDAVVLKHGFGTRLFHWGLVLGFLPAAFTGIGLWLRPFGAQGMHYVMLIHMIVPGFYQLPACTSLFFSIKEWSLFGGKY